MNEIELLTAYRQEMHKIQIKNRFTDEQMTSYRQGFMDAIEKYERRISADVQPIKHGRWYHNTSKYISELDAYFIQACCSCCGKYSDRVDSYSQLMSNEHCSHCGARMDGDTE